MVYKRKTYIKRRRGFYCDHLRIKTQQRGRKKEKRVEGITIIDLLQQLKSGNTSINFFFFSTLTSPIGTRVSESLIEYRYTHSRKNEKKKKTITFPKYRTAKKNNKKKFPRPPTAKKTARSGSRSGQGAAPRHWAKK